MKKLSLSALAAVGVLAGITGANAADLGGNCCADLEERIAELEATTVRKGNRKVSLTISGWVAQQVTNWDDGVERNSYVNDIGHTLSSHVKFSGSAKISPDLSAGYVLQIEAISNDSLASFDQTKDNGSRRMEVLQSFWFVKSETLGKISVGQQSSAYDNVGILVDGSGSLVPANYVMFDNAAFVMRKAGALQAGKIWGNYVACNGTGAALAADCDGAPNNNVRYDTPTFAGFSASASWGEDDIWGLAARYAGEFSGFKLAAAIGYMETTDQGTYLEAGVSKRRNMGAMHGGAYIQHVQTGLFVYGAYGQDYNTQVGLKNTLGNSQADGSNYYVKAGIRQKWSSLGNTVLFGEYGENDDKMMNASWASGITSTTESHWGLGMVQEIDAAAMSLWVVYRNYSAEEVCGVSAVNRGTCGAVGTTSFDDFKVLKIGGMISF
ncbi:MAG: porin [Hyphomicrobiaceae bacterium]